MTNPALNRGLALPLKLLSGLRFEPNSLTAAGFGPPFGCSPLTGLTQRRGVGSGEIDILEERGQEPCQTQHTICSGEYSNQEFHTSGAIDHCLFGDVIGNLSNSFHTYSIDWYPEMLEWFVDGALFHRQTLKRDFTVATHRDLYGGALVKPYDQPFHLLVNLAIGGNFFSGYQPTWDAAKANPAEFLATWTQPEFLVDYIRVYRLTSA